MISAAVLPEKISRKGMDSPAIPAGLNPAAARLQLPEGGLDLEKYIQELERAHIVAAIEACDGVGTRAAELLKMSYRSFRHYSKKYNIS